MVVVLEFIVLLVAAYLLGSVPAAYLVARWRRGIDIRRYGSGNVGASNVFAIVSRRWTIPVTIFDLLKGVFMVWLAQGMGLNPAQQIAVGVLTVVGHNWSLFLGFSGGRGIFTSLGVIFMFSPILALIVTVIAVIFAPFRQLPLGVSISLIAVSLLSWFLAGLLGIEEKLTVTLGFLAMSLIAFLRRLTAPRTSFTDQVSGTELFFYRLLFDRDIKDRQTWIKQMPGAESPVDDVPELDEDEK